MTVNDLGNVTVGVALPATSAAVASMGAMIASAGSAVAAVEAMTALSSGAAAAIEALVAASLGEVSAKLDGYALLAIPSPSFDIGSQVALAGSTYLAAVAELSAMPGGVALATTLTGAVAAQAAAQLAVKGFSPSIAAKIDAALSVKAGLDVQITAGVSGPNVNLVLIGKIAAELGLLKAMIESKLSIASEIAGELAAQASLASEVAGTIAAQAALAASISGSLAEAGVQLLVFNGAAAEFGAEIGAAVSGLGIPSFQTVVMVATSSGAWGAMQATLKTS